MVNIAASKQKNSKTNIFIFEKYESRQQKSCNKKDNKIEIKNGAKR